MGFAEVEGWAPPNACKLEVVGGGRVGEGGILGARGGVLKKKTWLEGIQSFLGEETLSFEDLFL